MQNENKLLQQVTGIPISDYAYDLPDERIAKYPLAERDQSKLLVWKDGQIRDEQFRNLSSCLPDQSLLIFNNTKSHSCQAALSERNGRQDRNILSRST